MPEPPDAIIQAIASFNRLRNPEAVAEVITFDENELILRFTGTFCQTCGVLDYFEDVIFELDDSANIDLQMLDFAQEEEDIFLVRYRVRYRKPRCAR